MVAIAVAATVVTSGAFAAAAASAASGASFGLGAGLSMVAGDFIPWSRGIADRGALDPRVDGRNETQFGDFSAQSRPFRQVARRLLIPFPAHGFEPPQLFAQPDVVSHEIDCGQNKNYHD